MCHPVTMTCVCGPRDKVGADMASCVDRAAPGVVIVPPEEHRMARYSSDHSHTLGLIKD